MTAVLDVCAGLDRSSRAALTLIGGSSTPEPRGYLQEPWPAGFVEYWPGTELIAGPSGYRKLLMRDHFLRAAAGVCDENWLFATFSGAGTVAQAVGSGHGVARLRAPGFDGVSLTKPGAVGVLPGLPAAIHTYARVAVQNLMTDATSLMQVRGGNIVGGHIPSVSTTNWCFLMGDDSGTQAVVSGVPIVAGEYVDLDLLSAGSGYCAGWVNGDGPYAIENLLSTAAWTITAEVVNNAAGTRDFHVDVIESALVSPIADPMEFAVGVGSGVVIT